MKNLKVLVLIVIIVGLFGILRQIQNARQIVPQPSPDQAKANESAKQEKLPPPEAPSPNPTTEIAPTASACREPSKSLTVTSTELKFVFSTEEFVGFAGKPDNCLPVGQEVEIWANSIEEPGFIQVWGRGKLIEPLQGERARIKVIERRRGIDAPWLRLAKDFATGL